MSSFAHLLTDTVTVAAEAGISGYGDPTYGSQTTVAARVEYDSKLLTAPDGSVLEVTHRIASIVEIPLRARVWLPGDNTGDNNAAKRVVSVGKGSTPDGRETIYEARV